MTRKFTDRVRVALAWPFILALLSLAGCDGGGGPAARTSNVAVDSDKSAVETYINSEFQGQTPKILKWHPKTPIMAATFLRPNGEKYTMGFDTREEALELIEERVRVVGERVTLDFFGQIATSVPIEFQFTKGEQTYFQFSRLNVKDGAVTGSSQELLVGDYELFQQRVQEADREWQELMNE